MASRPISIRVTRLGDPEPHRDPVADLTAAQRVALVETLTVEAWALSGRPAPTYSRSEMPIVVRALGGRASGTPR